MRKRLWIAVAAAGVALVAGVVLLALPREPSYQGRKLTSWLEDLSTRLIFWNFGNLGSGVASAFPVQGFFRSGSPQLAADVKAQEAIRRIGTNGLPKLVQLIRAEDSPLAIRALAFLKKQSLIKLKVYSADERRRQAFRALELLERDADPAWEEVLLDESLALKIREAALMSLGYSRSDAAVAPLISCLSVTNIIIRTNAIKLLSRLERKAKAAIPALLGGIEKENDPVMHSLLATALRQCEPDIVLSSVRSLKYDPPTYRAGAAASLGMFKQRPEISVPALVKSIDDPDPHVREAAVAALGDFGPAAHSATGVILKACNDPKKYVRMAATNALHEIGPH